MCSFDRIVCLLRGSEESDSPDRYESVLLAGGFIPVSVSVLAFQFCPETLDELSRLFVGLGGSDLVEQTQIVLTSPRAVSALATIAAVIPKTLVCFAVGPTTHAKAEQLGMERVVSCGGNQGGQQLASFIHEYNTKHFGSSLPNIVFPCGNKRRDELPNRLRLLQYSVQEFVVYKTVPGVDELGTKTLEDKIRRITDSDRIPVTFAIVFFSPSGVQTIVSSAPDFDPTYKGENSSIWIHPLRSTKCRWQHVVSIGPTTADALRTAGLPVDSIAQAPSPEGVLDALVQLKQSVSEDTAGVWWDVVSKGDEFFGGYADLSSTMKEGFINLSSARKVMGSASLSQTQYSMNMVASRKIRSNGKELGYIVECDETADNPINWYSAIPPTALRNTQRNFIQAQSNQQTKTATWMLAGMPPLLHRNPCASSCARIQYALDAMPAGVTGTCSHPAGHFILSLLSTPAPFHFQATSRRMANIGMMGGAYFVGKASLLDWINESLKISYSRVEDLCTGAVYCQLFDMTHPGSIPLPKVNFGARLEYEYIKNFKILQTAFVKHNVDKTIEVEKLSKGRYQDNLEFLQWFKAYHDRNRSGSAEYDAVARRNQSPGGKEITAEPTKIDRVPQKARQHPTPVLERPPKENKQHINEGDSEPKETEKSKQKSSEGSSKPKTESVQSNRQTGQKAHSQKSPAHKPPSNTVSSIGNSSKSAASSTSSIDQRITQLQDQIQNLGDSLSKAELDRDFYYQKLRKIEILCQENNHLNIPFMKKVTEILYATDDETASNPAETPEEIPES